MYRAVHFDARNVPRVVCLSPSLSIERLGMPQICRFPTRPVVAEAAFTSGCTCARGNRSLFSPSARLCHRTARKQPRKLARRHFELSPPGGSFARFYPPRCSVERGWLDTMKETSGKYEFLFSYWAYLNIFFRLGFSISFSTLNTYTTFWILCIMLLSSLFHMMHISINLIVVINYRFIL